MSNPAAFAALDRHIARVQGSRDVATRIAPELARDIERLLVNNIAAGVGPDGKAWARTKEGKAPLVNAAKALRVRAVDTTIVMTLEGPEALHHKGAARGHIERPILPTRDTVQPFRELAREAFLKAMGGGGDG